MKHSKAPFTIESGGNYRHIVDANGELLARVEGRSHEQTKREQGKANAFVFAAAPELLTCLKDIVRCIRAGQLGDYSPLMDEIFDAEEAISKAETGKNTFGEIAFNTVQH